MFFVRINDKNFIKAKLITSIEVIETDEKIETVIYNKNGEEIMQHVCKNGPVFNAEEVVF